jgi:hypothetical protein
MIPKLLYRFQTYPHRPSKIDPKTDKVIDRYGEVFDWKIWICFVRWCENWTLNWLSSLLLHKTHDDKNLFFFWRCPFYSVLTSIKKIYQDRCKVSRCMCYSIQTRIRTEEEVETLKTPYQQQRSSSRAAFCLIHPFPFYSVHFPSPVFVFFPYKYCKRG